MQEHDEVMPVDRRMKPTVPVGISVLMAAVFLAGLAIFSAACGGGGEGANGPRLVLEGGEFDLGAIRWEETVERSISFRNDGREPLEVTIGKIRPAPDAACGCGVEDSEVRPAAVGPGGTGELVFMLRAPESMRAMKTMQDRMLVELQSNDPGNPQLTITLVFTMGEEQDSEG